MAATGTVGESQLQRIIRDLQDAVAELVKEYKENGEPITDDSSNLHRFSYKLEYLLQFDQKEKVTFMGARKDYWDYFSECLAKIKGANDGIRFVKSIAELKTSLGKGRAFIRYSLVHQRLADTLQQCLMNQKITSDWYYTRSPLLKPHLSVDIISHLYELNEVQFDVASRGYDLDSDWPTFARRTLGGSPSHLWKPPSRSSSMNSLASSYCQVQELPSSLDLVPGEGSMSACAMDDLRLELDQSELRQRELLGRVAELGEEAAELRIVVEQLQGQLDVSLAAQASGQQELNSLRADEGARQAIECDLRARLEAAEHKNVQLLAKLDDTLDEKCQQAASHFGSAEKIHGLLDELNEAERQRLEAVREAEAQRREAEKLAKELGMTKCSLTEEQTMTNRLQEVVTKKDKESGQLQKQLEDLEQSLELKVCEVEDERKKILKEKENLQQRFDSQRNLLEGELGSLRKRLKSKDEELSSGLEKIKLLEKHIEQLTSEKKALGGRVVELESSLKDQTRKTEDYKTQCTSLMDLNSKLMQTVKRNEETKKELLEVKAANEGELAALYATEKQLRNQIQGATVAVDERERKLREENQHLDESFRRAIKEKETLEGIARELEQDIQDLKKELEATEATLLSIREELRVAKDRIAELETSLATSRESEASLHEQLHEVGKMLEDRDRQCRNLEGRIKEITEEKLDMASSLNVAQSQLELNTKEVSRLQAELLDLRAELRVAAEERKRIQSQLDMAESSQEQLAALSRQLKEQEEEHQHQHAETEESLKCAIEHEAQTQTELVSLREELCALKALNESLALEHADAQEGLHRANTETAELGVTVCRLTSDNQEAERRLEEVAQEAERLNASLASLQYENTSLKEEVAQAKSHTQTIQQLKDQLERAQAQATSLQETSKEEVEALRFQMSSEAMSHQNQLKTVIDEVVNLKDQLTAEQDKVSLLEAKISQLEATNNSYVKQVEDNSVRIVENEAVVRQSQEELQHLKETLARSEEELSASRRACKEVSRKLDKAAEEKRSLELKTTAEIEDLSNTKRYLEERLIELIRDKDALWQKSDALEFEQKLRAEERWWLVDKEASRCLGCRSPFTWWLRRHHCRLCGRIFCYYCSNNFAMTKHSAKKERCCRECYSQHCAVVERLTQAELGSTQDPPPAAACPASSLGPAPYTPTPRVTVTDPGTRADDMTFDIITDEELNGICDSDSASLQAGSAEISGNYSTGGTTPDEPEELTPALQDAEIHLLKSGELTLAIPLSVDEISQAGDGPRELLIRSSCYSVVAITVPEAGPTISWVFSSEPKSISFSVVYREAPDTPLEQAKVLIPLTRCNSHLETIQGQLKARSPGVYTLVFDNSYSRFISKKVVYHLTVEKPIIYDGSDF